MSDILSGLAVLLFIVAWVVVAGFIASRLFSANK